MIPLAVKALELEWDAISQWTKTRLATGHVTIFGNGKNYNRQNNSLLLSLDAVPAGLYPRLPPDSACALESDGR